MSQRALIEHLGFNLLFRCFVGLPLDEVVWNHSTFSKNRDRLLDSAFAPSFLEQVARQAEGAGLLCKEHFTVGGSLLEAWASVKSFRPRDEPDESTGSSNPTGRNRAVEFHGEKRSNKTHISKTDPEALLAKKGKGKEAKLCFTGHVLMENRSGLVVNAAVSPATGSCEWQTALEMLDNVPLRKPRITVGADKGYDSKTSVQGCRKRRVTPIVARKAKGSAIDGRVTRHEGYAVRQRRRKRVEEIFGGLKTVGTLRQRRYRGLLRVEGIFTFAAAASNVVGMRNLAHSEVSELAAKMGRRPSVRS